MDASIQSAALAAALLTETPPLLIDVRRTPAFSEARSMIDGALRRDPEQVSTWARTLPETTAIVVYCVHGHAVSQNAAGALNAAGRKARYLEGGIDHWAADSLPLSKKPAGPATRWITRERPRIDRIACPWLIRRFIDPGAEFDYVPKDQVVAAAEKRDAVPYDIAGVAFSHVGELCSFDAFMRAYRLHDPALMKLAQIVRGADTDRLDLTPQSAGLLAVSMGLSRNFADDHAMLAQGMVVYDALYAWCRDGTESAHRWNPDLG